MKKYVNSIFAILCLFFFPLLLVLGPEIGDGIKTGLQLAYRAVLPSIFPAAVVCAVLGELIEYLPLPPTISLWLNAQLCGFPLGIKTVARAYHRELISKEEAISLSTCCANASPAFLINYLGAHILKDPSAGWALWLAQILLSLCLVIGTGMFGGELCIANHRRAPAAIFAEGISSAAIGCLGLTGFIAFFSAISNFPGLSRIYPLLEITGGIGGLKQGDLPEVTLGFQVSPSCCKMPAFYPPKIFHLLQWLPAGCSMPFPWRPLPLG